MLKSAHDYANLLNDLFCGRGVPAAELYNAAKQHPLVPSQFWVDVSCHLRRWGKLNDAETVYPASQDEFQF